MAGITSLIGGDDALSAMVAVHIYGNRQWLGWYNNPGAFQIAKRLISFAKLASFHDMFGGRSSSKTTLESIRIDPMPVLCKDSMIEKVGYMAQPSTEERAVCDFVPRVVSERMQPIGFSMPKFRPAPQQLSRSLPQVKTTDTTAGSELGVAGAIGFMGTITQTLNAGQGCDVHSTMDCNGTIFEEGPNYNADCLPKDLTNVVTRDSHDPFAFGGTADIYRGLLQDNGKLIRVAIKAFKVYSGKAGDSTKKQRWLRREMKVWLNLRHIDIVPLLGTTMGFGRFPAMVSPWAENGPLTSYLEDHHNSLSVIEILSLLNNVASGLRYLHSRSVIHGDLSGSNVLVCKNGRACITDFGLSMLLTKLEGSTFATSRHAQGTLRWAAPELLNPKLPEDNMEGELPHVVPTTQSDVYSFGSVMLQILSGKVPYHYYKHNLKVMLAVCNGMTPRRPKSALVTDHRWMFVQRCWSAVDIARARPSSDEIVEFTGQQLASASLV